MFCQKCLKPTDFTTTYCPKCQPDLHQRVLTTLENHRLKAEEAAKLKAAEKAEEEKQLAPLVQELETYIDNLTEEEEAKWADDDPPPRRSRRTGPRKRLLSPSQWALLSRQNGVCALCGIPGWGTYKGVPVKMGVKIRSTVGGRLIGIFCRPCAAVFNTFRSKVQVVRKRQRNGSGGDGPGDQGGSGSE